MRGSNGHLKRSGTTEEEFNFYQGKAKWFRSVTFVDNTHKPGSKVLLIAQEVESVEYRRKCPVLILLGGIQGAWWYTW